MCSEIYLEASRRQEKRRLQLVQRDMAFEHIAVEVHRTIQVGVPWMGVMAAAGAARRCGVRAGEGGGGGKRGVWVRHKGIGGA